MKIALFTNYLGLFQFERSPLKEKIKLVVRAHNRFEKLEEMDKFCSINNIEILTQPPYDSPEYETFSKKILDLNLSHIISNQYSLIIRQNLLEKFPDRAINIHWSKLPKNRGPNPIQWSIIKNEFETGVTVHHLSDTIDQGPILYQETVLIEEHDTWVTLMVKLKQASNQIIESKLDEILINKLLPVTQQEQDATTNPRLNSDFPKIDFSNMTDRTIFNIIRAQIPPLAGAYLETENETIRFGKRLSMEEVEAVRSMVSEGDISSIKRIVL